MLGVKLNKSNFEMSQSARAWCKHSWLLFSVRFLLTCFLERMEVQM